MRMRDRLLFAFLFLVAAGAQAAAETVAEFYAGKTIQMIIGFGPGGGNDQWARILARFMPKHIPGHPVMAPQNMPGAGSFVAANYLYNTAPRDGTAMGIIGRDAAVGPLTGAKGARFDALRFTWIGTPSIDTNVCLARSDAPVKSYDDLLRKQLIIGDTGAGAGGYTYPRVLNAVLGTKFKNVSGFPGTTEVFLALQRGEVEGTCSSLDIFVSTQPTWIRDGVVNVLFQGGAEIDPQIPNVPSIFDLAKTPEQKQVVNFLYGPQGLGRPFFSPPDMPPDRRDALRKAFDETMKDPDFIAEAAREKLKIQPLGGERMLDILKSLYATPKSVTDKIAKAIANN
jgi:tripartite-type tricarboxylate transporter receptor subunit TctC